MASFENITIVLAHGAWADGSSWSEVIEATHKCRDARYLAAPLPLSSLSDDAEALRRTLARTEGPVILAGHAYAGAVIATANDERVRALVYIAALAPDKGETVADVFYRDEAHPMAPELAPDQDGWIWMPDAGFPMLCTPCNGRSDCACQGGTAADLSPLHPAAGARARLETEAFLVFNRCGRSHDQPEDAAFHGRAHGGNYPDTSC